VAPRPLERGKRKRGCPIYPTARCAQGKKRGGGEKRGEKKGPEQEIGVLFFLGPVWPRKEGKKQCTCLVSPLFVCCWVTENSKKKGTGFDLAHVVRIAPRLG